jgi:hypothetical protein
MRFLTSFLLAFIIAMPARAGLTYELRSVTRGVTETTLVARVAVDGANFRLDFLRGDDLVFRTGSFIVSRDGGTTLTVVDPHAKTYYDVRADQLTGTLSSLLGGTVTARVANAKSARRAAGSGPPLEGYATRREIVESSYDLVVDVMGQELTLPVRTKSESWTTDRIAPQYMNFLQLGELDRLAGAQRTAFPLREVTTLTIAGGPFGRMTTTTTTTISRIAAKTVAPADLAVPSGYRKVKGPGRR